MQLHATTYHLQPYFIIFTTNHCLLKFMTMVWLLSYTCFILTSFLDFHPTIGSYVHLVAKLVAIWVTYYDVFIHLMYTKVLWTTLIIYYINFIQSILNIYLTMLWAYCIQKIITLILYVSLKNITYLFRNELIIVVRSC